MSDLDGLRPGADVSRDNPFANAEGLSSPAMTGRFYTLDRATLEPFEIGAWLISLLAWPSPKEAEQQLLGAEALCAQILRATREFDAKRGAFWDERFPEFAAISGKEVKRRLRTLPRRLKHRMIAARMSLGFFAEGLSGGRQIKLPTGMARHSLNELSKLVQRESRLSDPEMVERRIWRESRYVIHLAAALQVCGRSLNSNLPNFGYPIDDDEAHSRLIEFAAMHESIVLSDERFGVKAGELVRLRQPAIQQVA
jgi:hypothetical protein